MRIGPAPVEPIRRLESGIGVLDTLLDGGLPRGHLSEIVGAPPAGGTALAWTFLATTTRRGELTAVIDLPNALHPQALWTAGADLERVLWVRPPSPLAGLQCTELLLSAGGFGLIVLDLGLPGARRLPDRAWPRLTRIAREAGTALAILAPRRVAGSFATLSIALTCRRVRWERGLLDGSTSSVLLARSKVGPPGRTALLSLRCGSDPGR